MIGLLYCALICQTIIYWDSPRIDFCTKWESVRAGLRAMDDLNYVSAKYGHEVRTGGASLKQCEPIPPKDFLTEIGYSVSFDGDGKVCREHF